MIPNLKPSPSPRKRCYGYRKPLLVAVAVVFAVGLAAPAVATTYDAVQDFNDTGTQVAGSVWTYGTEATIGGAFSLLPNFGAVDCTGAGLLPANCNPVGAVVNDYFAAGQVNWTSGATGINLSGAPITYTAGEAEVDNDFSMPTNVISMFALNNQVTRFTAPTTGSYDLTGFWMDLQVGANVALEILVNNTDVIFSSNQFDGASSIYQTDLDFSDPSLNLAAGDTVDFIESATRLDDDAVGLSATFTSVSALTAPEPASLSLYGAALVGFSAARRRRREARLTEQ